MVCTLVGYFIGLDKNIRSEDLSIQIDEVLIASKFTALGKEDGDLQLLDELISELTMSVLGRWYNRKDRRKKY